ncbi:CLUMA_CG004114, isoform A [Clunio marinus]|uniref:CLUMA_CG004114, isoform A n=1 Tax=Clunio marinus TaxID=568069 RepID=A0A1J1HSF5_9DIPT|nr:CLUMA_CG004114, isoform A [Clunio marinus]
MSAPALVTHLKGNKQAVTSFAFNPEGDKFVASSLDKTLVIYALKQENTRCLKFEQSSEVLDCDWSVKNLLASVGKNKIVNVFEPKIHKGYTETIVAHQSNIRSVHFSNSGNRFITASEDKSIKMFRLSHRYFMSSFTGHTNWVRCARFSPDNKMIASCAEDKTVKIFDADAGNLIHTFKDEKGFGNQLRWHPDNNIIAIAQENARVKIYDLRMRKLIQYYRIFNKGVNSLDFHPSGHFMITGSDDGLTKVLDLLEGRDIYTLKGHQDAVTAVKFSKDGEYFITGSKDRHIMIWKSNIVASSVDNDSSIEEVTSPRVMENKENRPEDCRNSSIIDARSSENYLPNDDVVEL